MPESSSELSAAPPRGESIDEAEVARFAAMAEAWWDPFGKFRPLHQLNPVRIAFVRDRAAARFGRDPLQPRPLVGMRLLDIGCGGGLISEPMARLGAEVVGADPAERNIAVARLHAEQSRLAIDYRTTSAETLARSGERFDIVLALEVLEHVADLESFLAACSTMVKPGGMLVMATLNRTLKAWALAIVGAEYVLGWLPRGTHDWNRFIRPHELARALRPTGLELTETTGVSYDVLRDEWHLSPDTDVNYMALATRNRGADSP